MVSKRLLDTFERMRGYDIVEKAKKGWGTWGIIAELERKTGISHVSIMEIRHDNPLRPSKILPKYYTDFRESRGYELLKEEYGKSRYWRAIERVAGRGFKTLKGKDPLSWNEHDFRQIWESYELRDPVTGKIEFGNAVKVRKIMRAIGRYKLLEKFGTKGLKRAKGAKRLWYLKDDELRRLINEVKEPDTLQFIRLGVEGGARSSAILRLTPETIDYSQKAVNVYEPKRREWVLKYYQKETLDLLRQFIIDFKLAPRTKIFMSSYDTYKRRLTEAGQKAGIDKVVTTHILKHTYVTQSSQRGVSLDTVSDQTGTDPTTLKQYYQAKNVPKMRHELFGEPYEFIPFGQWVKSFDKLYRTQYEKVKKECVKVDGVVVREKARYLKKPIKQKKRRKINWDAIKKMVKTFNDLPQEKQKTTPQRYVIPFWKKALKYHRQGLSDRLAVAKAKKK